MFSDIGFIYSNIQIKHEEMVLVLLFAIDMFFISTAFGLIEGR